MGGAEVDVRSMSPRLVLMEPPAAQDLVDQRTVTDNEMMMDA